MTSRPSATRMVGFNLRVPISHCRAGAKAKNPVFCKRCYGDARAPKTHPRYAELPCETSRVITSGTE